MPRVPGGRAHRWISRGIVQASNGRFSEERLIEEGRRRCQKTLQRSDRRYRWVPPSAEAWKRGERHIVCYGNGRCPRPRGLSVSRGTEGAG